MLPDAPQSEQPKPPTAWQTIWQDIHVNGSGLLSFAFLATAIIHPAWKEQCQQLLNLSVTYLFVAAKSK